MSGRGTSCGMPVIAIGMSAPKIRSRNRRIEQHAVSRPPLPPFTAETLRRRCACPRADGTRAIWHVALA